MCQGGWLAAAYAARFPRKVAKLVLAGAPIDVGAAESRITQTLQSVSTEQIAQALALSGGRVLGSFAYALWSNELAPGFTAEAALQCADDPALIAKFNAWNARTVDLPGAFFLQTAEWIFRENRLASRTFPCLGRERGLSDIAAPIFVLAAAEDEIVPLPQATADTSLRRRARIRVRVEPGRHLSLFLGQRTLDTAWREIARWLAPPDNADARPAGTQPRQTTLVEAASGVAKGPIASARQRKRAKTAKADEDPLHRRRLRRSRS